MRANAALLAGLAVGLFGQPGYAAPPKVPPTTDVSVGEDYILTIEVAADDSFGMAPGFDPGDCTFFEGVLRGGKKQFLVRPKRPGRFIVTFWTKGETAYAQTVIVAGGTPPPQPPGPGPNPPPGPTDPLTAALQAAFTADPAADKAERLRVLVSVFANDAASLIDASPDNGTMARAVSARVNELIDGNLAGVRKAVGAHLNARLPAGVVALTADNRPTFKAEYAAVAAALGRVK